jgi:hypothetical protein
MGFVGNGNFPSFVKSDVEDGEVVEQIVLPELAGEEGPKKELIL